MQQHVFLIQNGEDIFVTKQFCGQPLCKGRVQQFRPIIQSAHHDQTVEIYRAVDHVRVFFIKLEVTE